MKRDRQPPRTNCCVHQCLVSFTGALASGLWIAGGGGGEEAAFSGRLYVRRGEMSTTAQQCSHARQWTAGAGVSAPALDRALLLGLLLVWIQSLALGVYHAPLSDAAMLRGAGEAQTVGQPKRHSMKRGHEEIARSEFDALLRRLFPAIPIAWEEVSQAQEPPDWYVQIDSERYAVESTSIFDRISTLSGQMPSSSISATLHRFIDELEAVAVKEGILTGTYAVALCPIPDFPKVKEDLGRRLLDYIRDTQGVPIAPRTNIWKVGHRSIFIQKLSDEKRYVAKIISFDPKWEGEVQQELSRDLATVIETKKAKLVRIREPVILLILDTYHYADAEQWLQALLEIPSREAFHSICRIAPPDQTAILWSVHPKWQPKSI
ncbi:MAG: hypothetical protein H5T92_00890 [Synergistales bacterium]|nr:hypothetical protein [Synergistales bacterium]